MTGPSKPTGPTGIESIDLRVLVERYLDGVALIVNGKFRFANRSLLEMCGYSEAEARTMNPGEFLVAEDRPRAAARTAEVLGGGPEQTSTYRLLCKDSSTRRVEVLSRMIEYEGARALLSVIRDTSDREDAETRLRASEERYRRLYDDNPMMYFTVDRHGTVQSVNRFGAEQLGYEPTELVKQSVLKVFLEEDHTAVRRQLDKCLEHEDGVDSWELRKTRKDGSLLWVHERAHTVRDADGNPLVLIVCEDITEKKRVAEALRTRESQLRVLSELTSDCCWVRWQFPDGHSQREWITGSVERLTGYTAEEFNRIGRKKLVHAEDYAATLGQIIGPPGVSEHEFRIVTKSGAVRWMRERMYVEKQDDDVICVYGATWDVTESVEAEEELRVSRERMNQSQRLESLGKLAGGVAHDFNNLLMVIMGYGDVLAASLDSGPLKKHALSICKASERAAALTSQLLAFSRKQTLQPRVIQLDGLISDMGEMLGRLVPDDIELRLTPGSTSAPIHIDPSQLEQVLMNLIVNACDAISGGGKIDVATTRAVPDDAALLGHPSPGSGEYALLEVRDDGCGMDEATREHIFEPFFTTKGPGEGTGLGLSAVYGIVQQSHGFVRVESEPGQGTAMRIYFPITDESISSPIEKFREEPDSGNETLLLVEDEALVREMTRDVLSSRGYDVLEAAGPGEALRICRDHTDPIHLMLTDVVMPEMDGKRLADRVLTQRPGMKVLFMSGYSAEKLGEHGVLDPDVAFMQKPVSPVDLSRRVRELLNEG